MNKKTITIFFATIILLIFSQGCSKTDNPASSDNSEYDFSPIINDFTDKVVVATYLDLKNKTEDLKNKCEVLMNDSTQANLDAAADAWRNARKAWESSEGFLFGPVSFLSLDPSMDTWPLDESQLQNVLKSDFDLTPDFIRNGLGYSLRGFHTIEYFLFDNGQIRNAASLDQREREYLSSAAVVLAEDADNAYQEWISGFANEFKNAGNSGSRYNSKIQAVLQIIDGASAIADEVGNGKISEPYVTKNFLAVESQFSWNSLTDFSNNIRSIQNVYLGSYNNDAGVGLETFVNSKDPDLNTKVKQEITSAITAIGNIPEPFRNNLNANQQIQTAIDACNNLFTILETKVKPLVSQ
jgi:putative iron-regulated protein